MRKIIYTAALVVLFCACKKNTSTANPITFGDDVFSISTDKAAYKPGEKVVFTLNEYQPGIYVRYRQLNETISEEAVSSNTWSWQPPIADLKGYLAELFSKDGNAEKTLASIAIDVSGDWNKFPRYGFLSDYGIKTAEEMDGVIADLNRRHINGLQFYDWMDKHHQPLAGTPASPAPQWKDIANRDTYKSTVDGYIRRAHNRGMKAMFYNLCYGALNDAAADGVQPQWYMYRDANHNQKDLFDLPQPLFKSDIWFLDPSNTAWQQYLAKKNADVYKVYDFDGFHIDQVGNRDGNLYTYNGSPINLPTAFNSFITAMKNANPSKKLAFNAVNQYGQQNSIATAPVDFLYTEVWEGNEGYKDLAAVIRNNYDYSNGKASVLAAYMNYNKASSPGTFNTPGVLLTDAVIFSFGGAHIELGEHMLGKEYFPNNNLTMNGDLKKAITGYYDFLTAYENLLRDGGTFNDVTVSCSNGVMSITNWPPQTGQVAVQGKQVGTRQVLHFINFSRANSMNWRDTDGTQPAPDLIAAAELQVNFSGTAKKVWVASPDVNYGVPQELNYTQTGNTVKFTLPSLRYWDMVVIE